MVPRTEEQAEPQDATASDASTAPADGAATAPAEESAAPTNDITTGPAESPSDSAADEANTVTVTLDGDAEDITFSRAYCDGSPGHIHHMTAKLGKQHHQQQGITHDMVITRQRCSKCLIRTM